MLHPELQKRKPARELLRQLFPDELAQAVDRLEDRLVGTGVGRKVAAFDLDNTLLVGDIGEAVFAALRLRGYATGLSWDSYKRLVATDPGEAYTTLVRVTGGLPEQLIQQTTLDLLAQHDDVLQVDHSFVPVPYANPIMVELVRRLRGLGYQICVLTASNEISARIVAWRYFRIPPSTVFGICQVAEGGILTRELVDPLPVGVGKPAVYRKFMGMTAPVLTATDSLVDVPLLRMTDPRGLTMWVGEEKKSMDVVRQKVGGLQEFCFVARPGALKVHE